MPPGKCNTQVIWTRVVSSQRIRMIQEVTQVKKRRFFAAKFKGKQLLAEDSPQKRVCPESSRMLKKDNRVISPSPASIINQHFLC